ncbi:2-deoxyribose-5-phosphate aldolase, partial [Mycoplasmopsis synoviae]
METQDKDYDYVLNDIKTVKGACGKNILKVIGETGLLTQKELEKVTEIVANSGAEFIKTSTGFSSRRASLADIQTMQKIAKVRLL